MRQYLAEGVTGALPFIVDRSKAPVSESLPTGNFTRIPGRFSVCDCVNGNNRRYSRRVWEKNLTPGSVLQESIRRNAAFGLLEHPKDGQVSLQSPISHHVTKAELVESKDASGKPVFEIVGEISLYNPKLVPESGKLLGLIEGGYNPLVSSRGYGSLVKAEDGVDEVDEDYVCEGWDVVIKPSFEQAELVPNRSTTVAQVAEPYRPNPQAESAKAAQPATTAATLVTLKESSPSSGAAQPASETKQTCNTMTLNEIKARIDSLRSTDPAKPRRFAESIATIEELHQNIAAWAAEDTKRSWEASKMHKSLDELATGFTESVQQPAKEAKRLTEQNTKLMRVINAVASTAKTYKQKLGEALKADAGRVKMIEELTRRGQGWQRVAESRKQKLLALQPDFDTACESLDLMAARYHEDVTEMGRRCVVLEFKEKAQTPEIQQALKEATRLRHIVAVREKLMGKPAKNVQEAGVEGKQPKEGEVPSGEAIKDDKQKGAGSPEAGKVAEEPGKVKTESVPSAKNAQPVAEAKVLKAERDNFSVRAIDESVELVRRLSPAVPAN